LDEYHTQRQAMNRFFLGAMVLSDTVLEIVRRETEARLAWREIEVEEIRSVLKDEV